VNGQCENDPLDGVACDDGNPCTTGDQCDIGSCDGELVECDDSNACTDDACADGECAFLANIEPCDDGDACTSEDTCAAGACMGSTYSCDDGDACTADLCEGDGTCSHIPQVVDCDDSNACTADSCDGHGGCIHVEVCGSDAGADMGSATSTGDGCACRVGSRSTGATPWALALAVLLATRRRSTLR
jgi:MYXO-CTERM domain-containing protein